MSNLTVEKLRAMMASLPAAPRDTLDDLLRPGRILGMPVYVAPPPVPRIQVADIKFGDGTPLLPAAFRERINLELAERFGYREDPFKDRCYIFGGRAIVASQEYAWLLRNLCP